MARLFDDGSSEYLENANGIVGFPFAMGCWFYSDDATIGQALISIGNSGATDYYALMARGDQAGDVLWALAYDGSVVEHADTSSGYTVNTWHHACAVWAAAADWRVFIDGGSKGTKDQSIVATMNRTRLGVTADNTPLAYMSGRLAEAGIWDLTNWPGATASDKADSFEAIARPSLALGYSPKFFMLGLAAYWRLVRDEDQDEVGGYDMTPVNTPSVAAHPPMIYPAPLFIGFAAAAAGVVTHEAATAFAGAGTLTSAGLKTLLSVAALLGQGALTSAGLKALLAATTLTGQGALTAAPQRIVLAVVTLPGVGTLAAVGSLGAEIHEAAVALAGIGTLTASALRSAFGQAALTGQGTLTGVPMLILLGATALAGIGSLAVVGTTISGAVVVELTLDSRSFLLTLPTRSFELTQDTRDLGLTLEDR